MQPAARVQRLHVGIGVVEHIAPQAGGIDRERAIALCRIRLHHEGRGTVDVGRVEVTARRRRPGLPVGNATLLAHPVGRRAGDHRRVVGALDGDVDHLRRAVRRLHRHQLVQRVAEVQRLHCRLAVIQRVAPRPRGIDREAAVALRGIGLHHEGRRAIDVGRVEIAARRRVAGRAVGDATLLDHRVRRRACNHGRVVGALDGDVDHLRRAGRRRHRDHVVQPAAAAQRLNVGIVVIQRIGPDARRVDREPAEARGGIVLDHEGPGQAPTRCRNPRRAVVDAATLDDRARVTTHRHISLQHL